jgi:hypothetical protein
VGAVSETAPSGPVRGFFRPRPWPVLASSVVRTAQESGAHGRIADGGSPGSHLEAHMRWSAEGDSSRRSVL